MRRFSTWLREQEDRDDPVGDLARDFARDARACPSSNDYWLFRDHFRRAGWHVVQAFAGAWHEYKASIGRKSLRRHVRAGMRPSLRFAVLGRDGFRCVYCGASAETTTLHVDHVIPVVAGGETTIENLATSCQACNLGKGAKPVNGVDHEKAKLNRPIGLPVLLQTGLLHEQGERSLLLFRVQEKWGG